jgi:hypothetical protein
LFHAADHRVHIGLDFMRRDVRYPLKAETGCFGVPGNCPVEYGALTEQDNVGFVDRVIFSNSAARKPSCCDRSVLPYHISASKSTPLSVIFIKSCGATSRQRRLYSNVLISAVYNPNSKPARAVRDVCENHELLLCDHQRRQAFFES